MHVLSARVQRSKRDLEQPACIAAAPEPTDAGNIHGALQGNRELGAPGEPSCVERPPQVPRYPGVSDHGPTAAQNPGPTGTPREVTARHEHNDHREVPRPPPRRGTAGT